MVCVLRSFCMTGVFAVLFLLGAPVWAALPETVNIHGSLLGADGEPLTGARACVVRFFDAESDGVQLGGDLAGVVELSAEGLFNMPVDIPAEALAASALWYEVGIDTDTPADGDASDDMFAERIQVHSVPFALEAGTVAHLEVDSIGAGTVDSTEFGYIDGVTQPIQAALDAKAEAANLTSHTGNTDNPHAVTAEQVGLGNVDNTADAVKPISTDAQTALDTKADTSYVGIPTTGEAHVVVQLTSDAVANGDNLRAAYAAAAALTPHGIPLDALNRAVVFLPPGQYDLDSRLLVLNTDYVDIVGLSTAREDQHVYRDGIVFRQAASDIRIENLLFSCLSSLASDSAYHADAIWLTTHRGSPPATVIRNCEFRSNTGYTMRQQMEYAGTYENCLSDDRSFGSSGTASGTFINCTGGDYSFGSSGTASGTFINCTGDRFAFGGSGAASGTFISCTGGDGAFGGNGGTAAGGKFYHCIGGLTSFTTDGAPAVFYCVRAGVAYP